MLLAISMQRIDPSREDVYLASVDDQERVIAESGDFRGRTVLRSQTQAGRFWVLDRWQHERSMGLALAMARTIATVAALVEEPVEALADGSELARGLGVAADAGFCLVAEGWLKEARLDEYEATVRAQAERLRTEEGFLRRVLLVDRADHRHRWVLDEWATERAAYESFRRNAVTDGEALGFLALFAERKAPVFATTVRGPMEMMTNEPPATGKEGD